MFTALLEERPPRAGAIAAEVSERLRAEGAALKERFNRDFWRAEARTFGMGLDGRKRLVPAMTTNPGHCLLCGIIDRDKAAPLVARLLAPDMRSGWGLRTLSADEPQFNPMSYHNGTVWPHDTSLVIAGMGRAGFPAEANQVIGELFDAARAFPSLRLPELYCGFPRHAALDPAPAWLLAAAGLGAATGLAEGAGKLIGRFLPRGVVDLAKQVGASPFQAIGLDPMELWRHLTGLARSEED